MLGRQLTLLTASKSPITAVTGGCRGVTYGPRRAIRRQRSTLTDEKSISALRHQETEAAKQPRKLPVASWIGTDPAATIRGAHQRHLPTVLRPLIREPVIAPVLIQQVIGLRYLFSIARFCRISV
jgi:hypothetical protein